MNHVFPCICEDLPPKAEEVPVDERQSASVFVFQLKLPRQEGPSDGCKLALVKVEIIVPLPQMPPLYYLSEELSVWPLDVHLAVDKVERAPHSQHDTAICTENGCQKAPVSREKLPPNRIAYAWRLLSNVSHHFAPFVADSVFVGLLETDDDVGPFNLPANNKCSMANSGSNLLLIVTVPLERWQLNWAPKHGLVVSSPG
mmetsp:Transcript_6526/g.18210  ORF Transcript_6526/g.18210 Transcript_6526/m.18210 type:complete len:200 (+) Transcript_6526:801-1400(+)